MWAVALSTPFVEARCSLISTLGKSLSAHLAERRAVELPLISACAGFGLGGREARGICAHTQSFRSQEAPALLWSYNNALPYT